MMKKIILLTISIFLSSFYIGFSATGEVAIVLTPKNPASYTPVTATLTSYLFNVNTAFITWTVDGREVVRGLGEKKITIKTNGVGEEINVKAVAVTANNETYVTEMNISPQSVDILYEAPESYVPPFYEGRSLPGEGALVNFVAMPTISEGGAVISPSSLSYFWYVSGEFVDDISGIGKQSAPIYLDFLRPYTTVRVVVNGPRGTTAEKSIDVYPHQVLPLLYTYDSLLGPKYNSLLNKRFETTKNFVISLEPFFLSTKNGLADTVSYEWMLDGLPITPIGGTLLSMHPKESSYGSKTLSITVSNSKRRLQKTTTNLELIFDTR